MPAHAFIGTNRWNYAAWKDDFYCGVPRKWWLEYFDDDAKGYPLWNAPTLVEEILGLAPRACDKSNSPPAPRLREAKNPP